MSDVPNVRRATTSDAELLARHRAAVWIEVGGWALEEVAPQIAVWTQFFARHLSDGSYVAFVAERDSSAVGSGGIVLQLAMPHPAIDSERSGRLQSVYVEPGFRRTGIASAIVRRALEFARDAPLVTLGLRPSDDARTLYASLGFEVADEMIYRFAGRQGRCKAERR